jgi:signal transduction histidine kinase
MQNYDSLIEQVQEREARIADLEREIRAQHHAIETAQRLAGKRHVQVKTMQTLNLGVFSLLDARQIYLLACQSLVHQLGWDSAFAITLEGQGEVLASYQVTEKQRDHVATYISQNPSLKEAYSQHAALSTYSLSGAPALALRTLFHTDEVVAMPMIFGDHFFGFIVACAHTKKNDMRGAEDVDFLSMLASQIAHAVQNTGDFMRLEEQNQRLRQLDELKDSFISIASHQLRTPLSIVKWILSILQSDEAIIALPEQNKLIGQAYVSNERLIHVVNDLLNVSRIQEGKLPHNPQPADIRVVLREVVSGAERLAEEKRITIIPNIEAEVPIVNLDPILFKEAIQNLVDNAIDYNVESGIVRVTLEPGERFMKISVANSGAGISPDDIGNVFNQFYRSPSAVKLHPNGNGLGLYLSRAIARQHGGDITVSSDPGKETVFTVTLPIEQKNPPAAEAPQPQ